MSLNKYMHPRNPYKTRKPDFKALAIKYPEFRERVVHKLNGNLSLDFKDPACLRALTTVLLKEDFGLEVTLPLDRLIPTVPQRLNYVLWLDDILGGGPATGIDIGTGASCIYPLLGCKQSGWRFLASDIDDQNIEFARRNVQQNNMVDKIEVKKVSEETILAGLVGETGTYDFCMCNPPFFSDHLEAQGITSTRSEDRPPPHSVSTASPVESISWGGEVAFVTKMIDESLVLKERVRVYTSLLGKKMSLALLKDELRRKEIKNFSSTEFCQGRTMRWGIAWSFVESVTFPKSPFKEVKSKKPPITYTIPRNNLAVTDYTVPAVIEYLKAMFTDLQLKMNMKHSGKFYAAMTVQAQIDTWSHQRRKRRQKGREQTLSGGDDENLSIAETKCSLGESTVTGQEQMEFDSDDLTVSGVETKVNFEKPKVTGHQSSDEICNNGNSDVATDTNEIDRCGDKNQPGVSTDATADNHKDRQTVVDKKKGKAESEDGIDSSGNQNKPDVHVDGIAVNNKDKQTADDQNCDKAAPEMLLSGDNGPAREIKSTATSDDHSDVNMDCTGDNETSAKTSNKLGDGKASDHDVHIKLTGDNDKDRQTAVDNNINTGSEHEVVGQRNQDKSDMDMDCTRHTDKESGNIVSGNAMVSEGNLIKSAFDNDHSKRVSCSDASSNGKTDVLTISKNKTSGSMTDTEPTTTVSDEAADRNKRTLSHSSDEESTAKRHKQTADDQNCDKAAPEMLLSGDNGPAREIKYTATSDDHSDVNMDCTGDNETSAKTSNKLGDGKASGHDVHIKLTGDNYKDRQTAVDNNINTGSEHEVVGQRNQDKSDMDMDCTRHTDKESGNIVSGNAMVSEGNLIKSAFDNDHSKRVSCSDASSNGKTDVLTTSKNKTSGSMTDTEPTTTVSDEAADRNKRTLSHSSDEESTAKRQKHEIPTSKQEILENFETSNMSKQQNIEEPSIKQVEHTNPQNLEEPTSKQAIEEPNNVNLDQPTTKQVNLDKSTIKQENAEELMQKNANNENNNDDTNTTSCNKFTPESISSFSAVKVKYQGTSLRKDIIKQFWEEKERNALQSGAKKPVVDQFDETEVCLLLFKLVLRKEDGQMTLALNWINGSKEGLHQIMQLLRNRLAEVKT